MNIVASTTTFLKEVRTEAKKVNWLSRKELIQYTAMVIGFMVTMALFFGVLDAGYSLALEKLVFGR